MSIQMSDTRVVAWDESEITFVARLQRQDDGRLARWNGFVCPYFDRAEIDRYIAHVAAGEDPNDPYLEVASWDGDVLVVHDAQYADEPDYEDERIEPVIDDQGVQRWSLGAYSWTWYEVETAGSTTDLADYGEEVIYDPLVVGTFVKGRNTTYGADWGGTYIGNATNERGELVHVFHDGYIRSRPQPVHTVLAAAVRAK